MFRHRLPRCLAWALAPALWACTSFTSSTPDAGADAGAGAGAGASELGFVQANASVVDSVKTASVGLLNPTAAHGTIVAAFDVRNAQGVEPTVTDTMQGSYRVVGPFSNGGTRRVWLAVASDIAAGSTTVTVELSAPVTHVELYVHEYKGLAAPALEASAAAAASPACQPDASDCLASPLIDVSGPRGILFGFGISGIVTEGTGFTARSLHNNKVTEDRVTTSPGRYNVTATLRQNSGDSEPPTIVGAWLRARD